MGLLPCYCTETDDCGEALPPAAIDAPPPAADRFLCLNTADARAQYVVIDTMSPGRPGWAVLYAECASPHAAESVRDALTANPPTPDDPPSGTLPST